MERLHLPIQVQVAVAVVIQAAQRTAATAVQVLSFCVIQIQTLILHLLVAVLHIQRQPLAVTRFTSSHQEQER